MTENGREYSYSYDRRGNLTEECRDGVPVRRYRYDATNHMVLGKNLETGEKTEYGYNALYMRVKNVQTLTGRDALRTRETSYVPEYLSATNNELMAYEKGFGVTRSVYGRGYERLGQKVTAEPGTESMPLEAAIAANAIGKAYFQPDIYGSPLFATDGQGQVLGYVDRGIWGDAKAPVHGDLNLSGLTESLRFTSYCYDPVIGKYFAQARFYDSAQGRMLSRDPVKRGLNSYRYCDNDPVDYVDPTGEIANILIGGFLGGVIGGAFGFAGSAVSQLMRRKRIDFRKARGAAANGAVVGAVKGALVGSGVGLPLAMAADFAAGTIGSALEQKISEGVVDVRKSITSGLTNAVSGAIYGNNPMKSLGQALGKGAAAGGATSGINYLSDVLGSQKGAAGSSGIQYQYGEKGVIRARDPRRGCGTPDPFTESMGYGSDYGYQYNVPVAGGESQSERGFNFADFGKEVVTGMVTGGLASATFYGAGKAVGALKESIKSANRNEGYLKIEKEGMYRKAKDSTAIEPMPKRQLQRIVKGFKRQGGIIQMDDATDLYLQSKNAEAITYNQNTILLRQKPGRASVFEELIHATQYRQGLNDGSTISRIQNEIAAQEMLLRNSEAYKLTPAEIKQTQLALESYVAELQKLLGGK